MTKDFFKENSVAYEEKDVSTDAAARDEMIAKSNQMGVPVIVIDNKDVVIGFDRNTLTRLLDLPA